MSDNGTVKIVIDLDQITIGDLPLLDRLGKGEADPEEILGILDRVVEGGVQHLPLSMMSEITAEFNKATENMLGTEEDQKN